MEQTGAGITKVPVARKGRVQILYSTNSRSGKEKRWTSGKKNARYTGKYRMKQKK